MKFVFDLDGTLSFDYQTIDEDIKQVLLKAADYGHEVVFASARSYRDCLGLLGQDLKQNLVIGLNGGLAYKDGQLMFEERLEPSAYQTVVKWCQYHNLPFFVDDIFDYSGQILEKIPFIASVDPLKVAVQKELAALTDPIKMVLYMGDHEELLEDSLALFQSLKSLEVFYHAHEKCFYINPLGRHKASTIVELLGHDFIAFGNNQNDIEMFEASVYAVQIGDFSALKPYADDRVPTQDNLSHVVAAKILQVFADFRGK